MDFTWLTASVMLFMRISRENTASVVLFALHSMQSNKGLRTLQHTDMQGIVPMTVSKHSQSMLNIIGHRRTGERADSGTEEDLFYHYHSSKTSNASPPPSSSDMRAG